MQAIFSKVFLTVIAVCSILWPSFGRGETADRILRLRDSRVLRLEEIAEDLLSATYVFVGEIHSKKEHHRFQLAVIRTLSESGRPLTIGLEMIEAGNQATLDGWIGGDMDERDFARFFEDHWPAAWILYRDIFLFARENRIPMIGLNVPDEITAQVAREGFYSLSREQLARLPGVSCVIDDDYRRLMGAALEMHGKGFTDNGDFNRFCEAQMVWDTTMAQRLLDYASEAEDRLLLVLAGNTHAWKHGIPEQMRRRLDNTVFRVILPEIPGFQTRIGIRPERTDYLWLVRGY
ncbi:MAG: ChaN family lipoprotein [bacterium]|nr:MAG: ChaN family lipoprotein [bacterium]